jgi:Neuraminidase (sialidase)
VDRKRSEGGVLFQLVVDPGSRSFKDRVYAVFPAIVSDRIQIQSSYSADQGKTWSKPVTVNDDRSPEQGGKGPDHLLPSVAVNKDGVVLVTWYDRREAQDNLGWKLRAAASLDGGETFSASVPIADVANAYPQTTAWDLSASGISDEKASLLSLRVGIDRLSISGGHTSGLAVDADGVFHPTWLTTVRALLNSGLHQ